ncbi:protein C-mannosyl-transferase DPY19L1 isoform X2 [Ambystoma mexicanum]|uniref:protein C-mannosyl-transferase DPY19L1 isoform X2 n=1 Tax=Ambystoma mexicanum TaxID=8296 RepID=UPI0037E91951
MQPRRAAARGGRGRGRARPPPPPEEAVPRHRWVADMPQDLVRLPVRGRGGPLTRDRSASPPGNNGDEGILSAESSASASSLGTPVCEEVNIRHCSSLHLLLDLALGLTSRRLHICSTIFFAAFAGVLHWYHISYLFENDRHFSHLSTLEREMSFRTEMGLYYSFFKTIIEAPSFFTGLISIIEDASTEYPLVINALKRFNVYPEVVLAFLYRAYRWLGEFTGFQIKTCWTVNRGYGLSPVESCEGMGDPAYFYVNLIFVINGLLMSLFFIYGTYLSMSRLGGLVTVMCLFYNHGESTRVMWTPPLRESFSYPFIVLQMFIVTHILRAPVIRSRIWLFLLFSNVSFMLSWQFAQFVLLTQILCLFAVYVIGNLNSAKMLGIVRTHLMIIEARRWFVQIHRHELVTWASQVFALGIGTSFLKMITPTLISGTDDAHITNLVWSKMTGYRDFHTLMYTCAAEFDFMEAQTPFRYAKTLLLPTVVIVFGAIAMRTLNNILVWLQQPRIQSYKALEERSELANDCELVFHALQLIAYAGLAIFIMRLKLFLTPHMCLMASLICSRKMFRWFPNKIRHQQFVFAILMSMSIQGIANLQSQWNIIGEFSNVPQEELLEWITFNTKPNAVFAGAMPTMASIKLSTGRSIVNHPHYEDADLRSKTKIVYSVYSRKPAKEVKANLLKLGVQFYILEDSWCVRKTKSGCSMPEIWDVEDPFNAKKTPLCAILSREPRPHFSICFQNNVYKVLKIVPD